MNFPPPPPELITIPPENQEKVSDLWPDDRANSLRITGFQDFVRRPEFYVLENTTFHKLDLFLSSGERGSHLLCWVS
jgi:hypothetical protein